MSLWIWLLFSETLRPTYSTHSFVSEERATDRSSCAHTHIHQHVAYTALSCRGSKIACAEGSWCSPRLCMHDRSKSSNTVNLTLEFSFYSDLIRYTKVKGPDFEFWLETLMLPWNYCLNYSCFISGWVPVMDDLRSAYQIARLKEKPASHHTVVSEDDLGSILHAFLLTLGRLSFVIRTQCTQQLAVWSLSLACSH